MKITTTFENGIERTTRASTLKGMLDVFIDQLSSYRKTTPNLKLLEADIRGYEALKNESDEFVNNFFDYKHKKRVQLNKTVSNEDLVKQMKGVIG